MRASVILLIFVGAVIQNTSAFGSFKDVLQRAKEEASHIASSLRDTERVQAKLKVMQSDLGELYKMALVEARNAAEPLLKSGQESWAHFRARVERKYKKANSWLEEQHMHAANLHWSTVERVHGEINTRLPPGVKINRDELGFALFVAYSIILMVVLTFLLRLCF